MSDFVYMPIPVDRLGEVHRLLGTITKLTKDWSGLDQPAVGDRGQEWPEELVIRAFQDSTSPQAQVLLFLANKPETDFFMEDFEKATGLTWSQLTGVFGSLGYRFANKYGRGKGDWPFQAKWSPIHHKVVYRMSQRTAKIILKAAS